MSTKQEYVSLENLGNGAAAEMFAAELERVIANITDPNTKPDAARGITMKMKVKPNKERNYCGVEISCDSKLAPARPFETMFLVGMEKGRAVASEYAPKQGELFGEQPDVKGNIINLKSGSAK